MSCTLLFPTIRGHTQLYNVQVNKTDNARKTLTFSCVRVTIVVAEKQYLLKLWVCVRVFSSVTRHAKTLCHLWPLWFHHVFPHYFTNGTIFGGKLLDIKCVFWFSLQFFAEQFFILRIIQRDIIVNVRRCSSKIVYLFFLSYFNQTWILFLK